MPERVEYKLYVKCQKCNGTGQWPIEQDALGGDISQECPDCNGEGMKLAGEIRSVD